MKVLFVRLVFSFILFFCLGNSYGQNAPAGKHGQPMTTPTDVDSTAKATSDASDELDSASVTQMLGDESRGDDSALEGSVEHVGFHKALKTKFIEGNAGFMSLVALALVLGLAFCIERIIYLSLSEINAKKFMADLDDKIMLGDIEGAKKQCRETRGPCLLYTSPSPRDS